MGQQQRKQAWILTTQAEVAEALGTNRNTVASWVAKGMPGEPGRYPLPAIVAWVFTLGPWATAKTRREHLECHIRQLSDLTDKHGLA